MWRRASSRSARLASAALMWSAIAQPQPPPDGGSTDAKLVTLNVVALDNHSHPTTDLTQDDFQVFDRGKQQRVVLFRRNQGDQLRSGAPLGPHEFSNRSAIPPHVTLILLDLLNAPDTAQGYARNQLIRTVQHLESADYLYLYLLTVHGLYAVRDLPDSESISAGDGAWTRNIQPLLDQAMNKAYRMNPQMYAEDRVKATFLALEALTARLAAIPGRKSVVWITRGVPIDIGPNRSTTGSVIDYAPLVQQVSSTLDDANVAMYPVADAVAEEARFGSPGASSPGPTSNASTRDPFGGQGAASDATSRAGGMGSLETLDQLASLTGGRLYRDNDIGKAIQQAMDDARVSYLIGYSPAAEDWDGKYHKLRVVCARHGVRILAKQGYYAYPARRLANDQQTSIEAAKLSAVDAAGIGLRVAVSPSEKGPGAVHFQIAMEAADLTLSRQKDGYDGQVTVTFLVYNKDGSEAASKPEPFHLQLTPEQYNQAKKNGAPLSEDMAVNENVEKVRILLVDAGSNSIGSVTIPISAGDRSAAR